MKGHHIGDRSCRAWCSLVYVFEGAAFYKWAIMNAQSISHSPLMTRKQAVPVRHAGAARVRHSHPAAGRKYTGAHVSADHRKLEAAVKSAVLNALTKEFLRVNSGGVRKPPHGSGPTATTSVRGVVRSFMASCSAWTTGAPQPPQSSRQCAYYPGALGH